MRVCFYEAAAKKKSGAPEEYESYYVGSEGVPKALRGSVKVTLTEVSKYKSGAKKGRKKYHQKTAITVFVTTEEVEAAERDYLEKHQCCATCLGDKKVWVGWHHIEGNSYRPCVDCNETGKKC